MFYDNTRQGSHAVAAYTLVMSILASALLIHQMTGGDSSQFYLPLFETDLGSTMTLYGSILVAFYLLFAAFALLMSSGVKRELRFMILPWILFNAVYTFCLYGYGIWLVYAYYSLLWSVFACLIAFIKASFHVYFHLCVHSQYQLIKLNQMPVIEVFYPQM